MENTKELACKSTNFPNLAQNSSTRILTFWDNFGSVMRGNSKTISGMEVEHFCS